MKILNFMCCWNEIEYLPKCVKFYQQHGIDVVVADNVVAVAVDLADAVLLLMLRPLFLLLLLLCLPPTQLSAA